jgi:hypothetical protein
MPFFRRYSNGYLEADSGTTADKIIDTSLTQKDGFWNGSWFYGVSTQEVSAIRAFESAGNTFRLEVPTALALAAGDDYEIHSIWNAVDIKHALNRAIQDASQIWFDSVTDETLILQEDKLDYDISGLSSKVWILNKVFIENRANIQRGVIVSSTNDTFTVENSTVMSAITSNYSNWRISIYDGTGRGQIRTLSSVSGAQGTISAVWTTNPDTSSKYSIWDTTDDIRSWLMMDNFRLDSKEFPNTLHFSTRLQSHYGMRIHLEYLTKPGELSTEASTTIVPDGFLIPRAISYLYGTVVSDSKSDTDMNRSESERYKMQSNEYISQNAPHKPDYTMKIPLGNRALGNQDDPLDWR